MQSVAVMELTWMAQSYYADGANIGIFDDKAAFMEFLLCKGFVL